MTGCDTPDRSMGDLISASRFPVIRALLAAALLLLALGGSAQAASGSVVVLTATGTVDNVMASYLQDGIKSAEASGASAVVIQLNTPGGSVDSMNQIVQAELEARVRALIRRSQVVKSPKLRFGRLSVDTVARRASIGTEVLDLTPREWAVLEYLLMRIGQVVSKEHMLQAMCSWDDSLTHNAIEVYISRLRSKLHDAGIRIRTVRGFGYMVEDPDAV